MQLKQPFAGIKVLTVARVYAAPFAAYQLALQGADVISVEEPTKGDTARAIGSNKVLLDSGMGAPFLAHGANKKSLTLNLRDARAQEVFRKIARGSDVVIENLRVGDMDRYGLGYTHLSADNPRLIYASLTGYGQTGPLRRDAAIDIVMQAACGLMSITGSPQSGPMKAGAAVVDYITGLSMSYAIATALYHRSQTGEGQHLDVSLLESALVSLSSIVSDVQNAGLKPKLLGNRSSNNMPVSNTIMCADVPVVVAAASALRRRKLYDAIGRMDLLDDPRFATPDLLRKNSDDIYAEIERTLKTRKAAEWEEVLNRAGIPCKRVYSIAEAADSEHIRQRGLYHTFERIPGLDQPVKVPLAPFKGSKTGARVHSPPPQLGAHTDEILRGLGYAAEDIKTMRKEGAI